MGRVRNVLPRPVAHTVMVSARRKIWLISAAASRRAARSGDSATMRSQARSRAASSGQRATATQLNQCSTKYRAGSKLYSSRARAVAAVQSASNLARAAGSSRATAARIAAGSRSGSGTTGWSPDTGRWLMKPMLTHPSDIGRLPSGNGRPRPSRREWHGCPARCGHQPVNTGPDASSTRDKARTTPAGPIPRLARGTGAQASWRASWKRLPSVRSSLPVRPSCPAPAGPRGPPPRTR